MPKIDARLKEIGLVLPQPAKPVASYVPWVRSGQQVFISGQITMVDGKPQFIGRVGDTLTLEDGMKAARICAINILAQLREACGSDLDRVVRIVKLVGFVAAAPEFPELPKVMNAASDLMAEVFGDAGRHARSTIGVAALPLGVAVEIEAIAEVR
jgi:enamine deaminase RidA (YjgF/YER057c/UK114 family)